MDGTLTRPLIDFAQMYCDILGLHDPHIILGSPNDILHEVEEWPPNKYYVVYCYKYCQNQNPYCNGMKCGCSARTRSNKAEKVPS